MAHYSSQLWRMMSLIASLLCVCECGAEVNGDERTLAMVKPDCVSENHVETIKSLIEGEGFTIAAEKNVHFSEAEARNFYVEHSQRDFFPELIAFMSSGPSLALILEKSNAIADWRLLIGPTNSSKARKEYPKSIRAKFGASSQRNCVHGSDSQQSALREITLLFQQDQIAEHVQHEEL